MVFFIEILGHSCKRYEQYDEFETCADITLVLSKSKVAGVPSDDDIGKPRRPAFQNTADPPRRRQYPTILGYDGNGRRDDCRLSSDTSSPFPKLVAREYHQECPFSCIPPIHGK